MWPRRKIQLVASSAAPGIEGVRALLNGIELEFYEAGSAGEALTEKFVPEWWELPWESTSISAMDSSPVTELVYWPEESEQNPWREKAPALELPQQSIESLIHNIFEDELVLPVSDSSVLIDGRPLIGHVLNEAGFEPSILWPKADGQWQCERKEGLYWLLPESWLDGLMEDKLERDSKWRGEKVTWTVRESQVDFYYSQEIAKYIGQMSRWHEAQQEEEVYQNIAKCLEIGVSWLDIKLALSFIWHCQKV